MKHYQILTRFVLLAGLFLLALSFISPVQAREIWLNPVEKGKKGVDNWGGVKFGKEVHFHLRVPDDFDDTTGTATIVLIGLKDQEFNYRVNVSVTQNGQQQDKLPVSGDALTTLVAGQLQEINVSSILPALIPGDYVALNLERLGKKKVKALIVGMRYDFVDQQQTLLAGVTRNGNTLRFEGMNVQIVDGSGDTAGPVNGLGNLIIGYDETRTVDPPSDKTGSHNLVVGQEHNYPSYGGLVAGFRNIVFGSNASVSGGQDNTATGDLSSVSGGLRNTAILEHSSVSGGRSNIAMGSGSSVSGGFNNTASGPLSSVSGGNSNTASGQESSVSGGELNIASNVFSSVSGGMENEAGGIRSSVSGGWRNITTVVGNFASISGGQNNTASMDFSSVSGGQNNTASGVDSSVSGGSLNTASGAASSVSGGVGNTASIATSSVSGGDDNIASGISSSVSGGSGNTASGTASSVSGGASRSAPGTTNWAAGSLSELN